MSATDPAAQAAALRTLLDAYRVTTYSNYVAMAGFALVIADYLHTLPEEVRYMWSARLSLPKVLFFILRYYVFVNNAFTSIYVIPLSEISERGFNRCYRLWPVQGPCPPVSPLPDSVNAGLAVAAPLTPGRYRRPGVESSPGLLRFVLVHFLLVYYSCTAVPPFDEPPGHSHTRFSFITRRECLLPQSLPPSCARKRDERLQEEKFQQEAKDRRLGEQSRAPNTPAPVPHKPWEHLPSRASAQRSAHSQREYSSSLTGTTSSSMTGREPVARTPASRITTRPPHTPESPSPGSSASTTSSAAQTPQADDIRTEYHHNSGRPARQDAFEDYRRQRRSKATPVDSPHPPWHPFESRADFEFAELALKCCLNQSQITAFLNLIQRCSSGEDKLHFNKYEDLADTWAAASHLLTPTTRLSVEAKYKNIEQKYDFWSRPVWDWALDLVRDPALAPYFEWDAQKLFKYDTKRGEWVRFVNEPWTGDRFYEIQTSLPEDGKPLCFIFYADKTELSSFGGEMGYPVYARIANLPISIRNGSEWDLGGGRIVGYIPAVKDADQGDGSDKSFVDFKRVVWHACFLKIFTIGADGKPSFADASISGSWVTCGDGVARRLYPVVLILSADYEEQCVMANIRGANGKSPCPRCLVKKDEQIDLSKTFEMRDHAKTEAKVQKALGMNATKADDYLKPSGMRPVKSAFAVVANSDPFKALSFDQLHAFHNGLGAKHLWQELRDHTKRLYGEDRLSVLETRASSFPPWSGLSHFHRVLSTKYQDGNKNEDLMKISLYIAFNLFPSSDELGVQLLRCIRSYLNLDTLASFINHDENTVQMIVDELTRFEKEIKEYIRLAKDGDNPKNWNFPKIHSQTHLPYDIWMKGVTRNANTKPNEAMHRMLKEFYLFMTNFKNFEGKILELEHWCYTAAYIRARLNQHDGVGDLIGEEERESVSTGTQVTKAKAKHREDAPRSFGNVTYRSPDVKPTTFSTFQERYAEDGRFAGFQRTLTRFLSDNQASIGLKIDVKDHTKVHEYHCVQAFYECKVTWETDSTLLRCSKSFHGRPRYDCIMYNDGSETPGFGRLISLFTIVDSKLADGALPLAFVELYNGTVSAANRDKDSKVGVHRVRTKAQPAYSIIFGRSIIRGALLVPAFDERDGDYLLFDISDGDMYLRAREFSRGLS